MADVDRVTDAMVLILRGFINEPTADNYSDDVLKVRVAREPLPDANGVEPWEQDISTDPPTLSLKDTDWIPTFDLHRVAADIWDEKSAVFIDNYNYSAEGASYSRSQVFDNYRKMARKHRSLASARCVLPTLTNVVSRLSVEQEN